jgi:6-pyruvoyltetrahydropterin/6-carboxytetrahydropterin synthase
MFRLAKTFRFEASHQLMHHDGKCARLHGHSWKGQLIVEGTDLIADGPKENMLIDYGDLSAAIKPIVEDYLDHHHLNDTLQTEMPTSEFLAKWIYEKVKPTMSPLVAVVIEETCTSRCEYRH